MSRFLQLLLFVSYITLIITAEYCDPGFATINNVCTPCKAGTFSAGDLTRICEACPAGTYSLSASETCTLCAAGYISVKGAYLCTACPPGKF